MDSAVAVCVAASIAGFSSNSAAQGEQLKQQSRRHLERATELARSAKWTEAELAYQKAVETDPSHVEAFKRYAGHLLQRRQFAQAEVLLRRGLTETPGDPYLDAYLAVVQCWTGREKQALAKFKALGPFIAKAGIVQVLVAECMLYNGDYRAAAKRLEQAIASLKSSKRLIRSLRLKYTRALVKSGQLSTAGQQLALIERNQDRSTRTEKAQVRALTAELLLRRGRCKAALDIYRRLDREADRYAVSVAATLFCLRRFAEADKRAALYLAASQPFIQRYLGGKLKHPNLRQIRSLAEAAVIRGDVSKRRRKYRHATKHYQLALDLAGRSVVIDERLAAVYFDSGRYTQCLERLERYLTGTSALPGPLRLTLRAAVRSGKKVLAVQTAEQLLRRGRGAQDLYLAGVAYKSRGDYPRAIRLLERAVAASPRSKQPQRDLGVVYLQQARRLARATRLPAAIKRLKQAARLAVWRPDIAKIETNLALLHLRSGDAKRALSYAKLATRRGKAPPIALWIGARALARLRRHDRALEWYHRALDTKRTPRHRAHDEILVDAAVTALALGKSATAVAYLEQVDRSDPNRSELAQRNLVRAHYELGRKLLRRDERTNGRQLLERAINSAALLPNEERALLLGNAFFVALTARQLSIAQRLLRESKLLAPALQPQYATVARRLLPLLISTVKSRGDKGRGDREGVRLARAALGLTRAAKSGDTRPIRLLAAALLQQAAHRQLAERRTRGVARLLTPAAALLGSKPPSLDHNLALSHYSHRSPQSALEAWTRLAGTVPLANCNLGAHRHNAGQTRAALKYFEACQRQRGAYPELDEIVRLKRSVFGGGDDL